MLLIFLITFSTFAETVYPLKDVKPRLIGKGKTVFQGRKIEEFDVEILGVLKNPIPGKNLIIARLKGDVIQKANIIQGMSGSPVFVDGKFLGTVSYAFPWSTEPVAGITPAEDIISIPKTQHPPSPSKSLIPFKKSLELSEIKKLASSLNPLSSENTFFHNIPVITNFGSNSSLTKSIFSLMGLSSFAFSAFDQSEKSKGRFMEGDAIAVQLIRGDWDISAIGTVSLVEGDSFYAFGHPLFNLGSVDFPVAKAEVITVVPNQEASFKLATIGESVGRLVQDRYSGIYGKIGEFSTLIPLKLEIEKGKSGQRELKFEIVNQRLLSPILILLSIYNSLLSEFLGNDLNESNYHGDISISLQGEVIAGEGRNVKIEDYFSGESALLDSSILPTSIVYYLLNNEFESPRIQNIKLKVSLMENLDIMSIERVWVEGNEVEAGKSVNLKVFLKTWRGKERVEEVSIPVPKMRPGQQIEIVIADAESMYSFELKEYKGGIMPRSMEQLIRALNNLRKNNRIYFKIRIPVQSAFLMGEEISSVPYFFKSIITSQRVSSSPVPVLGSTIKEYQYPVDKVVKGFKVIKLKIKE
ncbi:MAG: SpoIVB peptidase S55 domain-containing protein [Candidatus Aminicenantia bacterium]